MKLDRGLFSLALCVAPCAVGFGSLLGGCASDDGGDQDAGTSSTAGESDTSVTSGDTTTAADTGSESDTGSGSESGGGCVEPAPSLAADVEPIFTQYCVAGCHVAGGTWQFVDLSAGNAYDAIVGIEGTQPLVPDKPNLVEPFSTAQSYLWAKITARQTELWSSVSEPMPYGCTVGEVSQTECPAGAPPYDPDHPTDEIVDALSDAEFETIENWINCGAEP